MEFSDHRFTVSEVAELTETKLNTIQSWRRKGFFSLDESDGWHRFTLPELFSIAVFSEVTSWTGNHDVASSASSLAVQMLTEIIDEGAVPYFIGAARNEAFPVMEITYGAREVGRTFELLIGGGADCGAFIIVDYSSIFHRLLVRLHAGGYAKRKPDDRK